MRPCILHVDMDAFFASVEQRRNPELLGRPVIVGGVCSRRGVVCSASYEARPFGIRSGMSVREARRRCPRGVFLDADMQTYAREGKRALLIYRRFTPSVEPVSIDEAFLDVTGSLRMFGGEESIARRIKAAIRDELSLTASVGIGPNRLVAKIASDLDKPDGLTIIRPEDLPQVLDDLPVSALWGVGPATGARLQRMGVRTVEDLRRIPAALLEREFGAAGRRLYDGAWGVDHSSLAVPDWPGDRVSGSDGPKSISHEVTLEHDTSDRRLVRLHLLDLCERVAARVRGHGCRARTVTLKLKFSNFDLMTRASRLDEPTDLEGVLFRESWRLLQRANVGSRRIRLIGVGVSHLSRGPFYRQMSLFGDSAVPRRSLAKAKDSIRDRYGRRALMPGSLLRPGAV